MRSTRNRKGFWGLVVALSLVAVTLVAATVVTFGFYAMKHYRRREAEKAAGPTRAVPADWALFASSGGDFTVLLPGAPSETVETVQRDGGAVTLRSVVAVAGLGAGYSVMVADAPSDGGETSDARLDRLEAEFVHRSGGRMLARSAVSAGGVVGRELRVDSSEHSLRFRLFAANHHLYQVLVIRPPAAPANVLDERFLGSFTVQGS